jgi:zeta-carotene desaturase
LKPVVIVGGGLSGLAAGVGLSSRGIPVVLLEQRYAPGGRAYSFLDKTTGDVIDNGQHLLIAGYHHTLRFLTTIGTLNRVTIQPIPTLIFHHPTREFCTFSLAPLPQPLQLLSGVIRTDLFSLADKLRLLRAGAALRFFRDSAPGAVAGQTIDAWLTALGQTEEAKRSFWVPLATAIMNERINVASALLFVHALRAAFLSGRNDAALVIPRTGLSDLYVNAAREFIERAGGVVRCRADVVETVADGSRVVAVRTKDGNEVACAALILAVPSHKARSLLPTDLRASGFLSAMEALPASPIVSIHLWFASDFMPQEIVGVVGKRVQWIFNRRKLSLEKRDGGHVSTVISAGYDFTELTNDQLAAAACEDLREIYGKGVGEPTHAVVIREKRATFSCTPAAELLRPGPDTPFANLFLSGDWTATGLPATIEGAIISGERCVQRASAFVE